MVDQQRHAQRHDPLNTRVIIVAINVIHCSRCPGAPIKISLWELPVTSIFHKPDILYVHLCVRFGSSLFRDQFKSKAGLIGF